MKELEIGDIVKLKGTYIMSLIPMLVVDLYIGSSGAEVECIWFDVDNRFQREYFKKDLVEKIKNVYKSFTFPVIRRIIPDLIATDLVSVQPLSEEDYNQLVIKNLNREKKMKGFKLGEVVRLKGSIVTMTVEDLNLDAGRNASGITYNRDGIVSCVWFDVDYKLQRNDFKKELLEEVPKDGTR